MGIPSPQLPLTTAMDRLQQLFFYCCLGHPEDFHEEDTIEVTIHKVPSSLDLFRETGDIIRVQPRKQNSFVNTTEGDEIMGIPMDHIFHNSQQV